MSVADGILKALERRAAKYSDTFRFDGSKVPVRCFQPDKHQNGDANPSAVYTYGKYLYCRVCGFRRGEKALAIALEVVDQGAPGLTLEQVADAKGLPLTFLQSWGLRSQEIRGANAVVVPWYGKEGVQRVPPGNHLRHHLGKAESTPRWTWDKPKGVRLLPYGCWRISEWLEQARSGGIASYLLILESELDVLTCWYSDIPAIAAGGADGWRSEWAPELVGFERIIVWQEPDTGGEGTVERVGKDLPSALVLEAPPDARDTNALWLACGGDKAAFQHRIRELVRNARPLSEIQTAARREEASQALAEALAGLPLDSPGFHLLDAVEEAIRADGWAGDTTPPLLSYVAITSRLLERPMNLAFIAPSGAGKNRAAEAPLPLFPASAYFIERAGSARALVYSGEDFQHRTVIVAEADSIPEEGPAASAVRSLAADNAMEYDVVEQDPGTGKYRTRRITKPGPTGLITTSVKPLGEQLSTRLLTVTLSDTADQTRAVVHAHADEVNGVGSTLQPDALLAFQRWLELAGRRAVSIPFAHRLADLVPVGLVRMRRDSRQLFTAIQAIALLNQRQRDVDGRGRIVATAEDYDAARNLLLDVFGDVATGGVTPAVRQTARAVAMLYVDTRPVSLEALAAAMNLSSDTTKKRVRRARSLGYVVNLETRDRQPMKLTPGALLPEDRPSLPKVEELFSDGRPLPDSDFPSSLVDTGETGVTGENTGEQLVSPEFPRKGTGDSGEHLDSLESSLVAPIERKASGELGNIKSGSPLVTADDKPWGEV